MIIQVICSCESDVVERRTCGRTVESPGHQLLYDQEDDDRCNVVLHRYWDFQSHARRKYHAGILTYIMAILYVKKPPKSAKHQSCADNLVVCATHIPITAYTIVRAP